MTPQDACLHVRQSLGLRAIRAEPLSGGLLNHVYRVYAEDGGTVVVKHAPPHVASAPHIPLDPRRSAVEATALRFLGGRRAPRLLHAAPPTLILEDIGDGPDLATYLADVGKPAILDDLATWLRGLHEGDGPSLQNPEVQQTRLVVQYQPAGGWLAQRGVPDAAVLGRRLLELGQRFVAGGPFLVMGDLWPPSVRVRGPGNWLVLDWEFATRGHRSQDLGHLAAHLDLEAAAGTLPAGLAERFLRVYGPITDREVRDTRLHRSAEVLARTIGVFPRADLSAAAVDTLVAEAVAGIRHAGA